MPAAATKNGPLSALKKAEDSSDSSDSDSDDTESDEEKVWGYRLYWFYYFVFGCDCITHASYLYETPANFTFTSNFIKVPTKIFVKGKVTRPSCMAFVQGCLISVYPLKKEWWLGVKLSYFFLAPPSQVLKSHFPRLKEIPVYFLWFCYH